MNPKEFLDLVDDTFARMKSLTATKGVEYKGGETYDQFANFKRYAQRARVTIGQAWSILFGKHLDAIDTFIRDDAMGIGRNRSEPIEGRIDDAILYLLLLKGMVRSQDVGFILDPGVVDQRVQDDDSPFDRAGRPSPVTQGTASRVQPFVFHQIPDRPTTHSEVRFPPSRGPFEFSVDFDPHDGPVLCVQFPGPISGMPHTIDAVDSGVPAAMTRLVALVGGYIGPKIEAIGSPAAVYVMSDDEAVSRGMCRYLGLITSAAIASPAFIPRSPAGAVIVYVVVGADPKEPQKAFADRIDPDGYSIPAQFKEAMGAATSKGHVFVGVALAETGEASTGYLVVSTMVQAGA